MYVRLHGRRGAQSEIARHFGVTEKAVSRAKIEGRWDDNMVKVQDKTQDLLNNQIAQENVDEVAMVSDLIKAILEKLKEDEIPATIDNLQKLASVRKDLVPGNPDNTGGGGNGINVLQIIGKLADSDKSAIESNLGAVFGSTANRL